MPTFIPLLLCLLASMRSASAAVLRWPTRAFPPVQKHLVETVYITKTICDPGASYSYLPTSTSTSTTEAPLSAQDANPKTTQPPALLTISLVNSHTAAISTTHNSNSGVPRPASGATQPGTLAAGATAAIAVPTNWAGIISVNDARNPVSDKNSLIEANYQNRSVEHHAIADLDVSYVYVRAAGPVSLCWCACGRKGVIVTNKTRNSNGFTLPITCSCNGLGVTGCNKDLFSLGSCPVSANAVVCLPPTTTQLNYGRILS